MKTTAEHEELDSCEAERLERARDESHLPEQATAFDDLDRFGVRVRLGK